MDTHMIKEEIRQILETLIEQWEMVQQHEGHIPHIELDLIQANIRELYVAFYDLGKKNDEVFRPPAETVTPSAPVPAEPVLPTPPPPPIQQQPVQIPPPPVAVTPPLPEEPATPEPPEIHQASDEIKAQDENPATTSPPLPKPEEISFRPPKPEPDLFSTTIGGFTISDKLKEEKVTLNEKLQQDRPGGTLSSRLHENPIKDLKSSIGINEKFLFINALFNGSMQDYAAAITELNQFNNYEEALKFIDILKFKYNWDTNSDAYHKIMDFVRRRYL